MRNIFVLVILIISYSCNPNNKAAIPLLKNGYTWAHKISDLTKNEPGLSMTSAGGLSGKFTSNFSDVHAREVLIHQGDSDTPIRIYFSDNEDVNFPNRSLKYIESIYGPPTKKRICTPDGLCKSTYKVDSENEKVIEKKCASAGSNYYFWTTPNGTLIINNQFVAVLIDDAEINAAKNSIYKVCED